MADIFVPDPLRKSVEAASDGKQTVLRTAKGNPTYMNIVPRMMCEDLGDGLGTGPHEAFIVRGREVPEIMIGTYQASIHNGEALSLPYQVPRTMISRDDAMRACLACGPDYHLATNWESAALCLWMIKNNIPRGNTDCGRSHSHPEEAGIRCEHGKTLTGSGPLAWRHDGTSCGIADLVGNVWEHQWCLRSVGGRIMMPPDNDFTLPEEEWPDTGVCFDGVAGIRISGRVTKRGWFSAPFAEIGVKTGYEIPASMKRALLCPSLPADPPGNLGRVWVDNSDRREAVPLRFGVWSYAGTAGVGALSLGFLRTSVYSTFGFRLAYISNVRSV